MSLAVPLHLSEPQTTGYIYGELRFTENYNPFEGITELKGLGPNYIVEAEPAVLETAKRVFRGCQSITKGQVRFPATRRSVEDLCWLMQRFPLRVTCPERFAEDRQKAIAHAQRRDSNLVLMPAVPPPTFRKPLYPFQEIGVAFLCANERTLLADDMGLGKTIEGLAAVARVDGFPAVFVVPTNVQEQWRDQAGHFLDLPTAGQLAFEEDDEERGNRLCHIIQGRKPYPLSQKPIYIIHYGLLADWYHTLMDLSPKAVVFDEIQELRHPDTQKYTGASDLAGVAQYVFGLSGTPIYNYGDEIWAITNILEYHCLGDRDSFTKEWCYGYGQHEVMNPDALGDYLRREGLLLRRRKSEVWTELPPKRRRAFMLNHDRDKYAAMVAEAAALAAEYDSITDFHERGRAVREIESADRQATGIAKAPYVAAFVKGLLDVGERVLIYAHHHSVYDILKEELASYNPVEISGRVTPKAKKAAKAAFMDGKTDVILISLRGAAGLDGLQERGTTVVFAELDWSPALHSQCEDRLHRIGLNREVQGLMCYYLVTDTGSDEAMQAVLGVKTGQFVGIVGDEPETEEDRDLADQAAERHMGLVIEKLKARHTKGG